jgi:two-component system cell cycle sensor histidine kinase/response regulator CckA
MRKSESNQWFRRYAMVIVVACIGIFITFSGFLFVRRVEIQRVKTELLLDAREHVSALEKEISVNFSALQSLHSFFKGSEVVTREEFRIFAEDVLQYTPGFQALEWIPRVLRNQREEYERSARIDGFRDFQITERQEQGEMIRAAEREEYFPVYFVDPYKGNEIALGYDLASNPARKAALEKSRDTGQMIATTRITLVQETDKQYGFLVFLPVYQKMTSVDTIEARRKNLIGFVLGVYRIGTIVNNAFKHLERINSYIYDMMSPPDESFLYAYPGQTASNLSQIGPKDRFKVSHQLNIADRQWQLVSELPSDFTGYFPMAVSWGALAGGLLVTCLLAAYLITNIKRTIQIEEIANELSVEVAEHKQAGEALRRSENKYRLLFDGSTNGIMAFDIETKRFVYANPAAVKMFGYSEIELQQMRIADFHPEDSLDHVISEFESQARGEKAISSELPCLRKDGTIFYADIVGANTIIDGRECSVGFITDVSERKHAEESLCRNEAELANACEMAHLGPWEYDVEKDLFTFTDSFYAIFGTTAEKVGGYTMSSTDYAKRFVHPEDVSVVGLETRKAIETDDPNFTRQLEHRFLYADGKIGYISVRLFIIKDSNGRTIRTYGVNQDITERKHVEEASVRAAREWQTTFDATNVAMWILDKDQRVLRSNKTAERMFQRKDEEMVGKHCWEVMHGTAQPIPECPVLRAKENLRHETMELKIGESWFEVSADPILDANGQYAGAVHVIIDVTEHRKLEAQLRQSQKMEAIGTLAGGIAHDFNNILTTIIGNAELMLMTVDKDESLRKGIEDIKIAGERAAVLTRQLLAFSRKQIVQPKVLDLNKLLTGMEKMLVRLIGEDIEILMIQESALWKVETDPGQMEQVIMNLVVNARDSMPIGGKLTIETANMDLDENYFSEHGIVEERPGSYVMLAVSDTGSGMDKEVQEHIFDPFYTTKEKGKGTGLGLSTLYGIAKQNNGFIWVYSEPGQGSTFKIYLPKVKGDVKEEEIEQTPVENLSGSETVLIVEDDDSLRKLTRTVLKQRGYKILEAENGEDALRISKEHEGSIDLMITDVVMPKMSGKETAERLQPLHPQMKVIYMSGYTDDAIVHHGVLAAGLNFLEKPFSLEGLARKVREVLDK